MGASTKHTFSREQGAAYTAGSQTLSGDCLGSCNKKPVAFSRPAPFSAATIAAPVAASTLSMRSVKSSAETGRALNTFSVTQALCAHHAPSKVYCKEQCACKLGGPATLAKSGSALVSM